MVLVSGIWVGFDSKGRDFSGSRMARTRLGWVIGTLGLWLVFFPAYLVRRGKTPPPPSPAPRDVVPPPPAVGEGWDTDGSVPPPR